MILELSYKNIKKSLKDYTMFFLTLMFGVAVFYLFSALQEQAKVLQFGDTTVEFFGMMMNGLGVFVAIILGALIVYASSFLIKRRKKEFAIYMLVGMKRRKIALIMIFETILIGIVSLLLGLLLGILCSQGMSILIIKLFEVNISRIRFVISMDAIIRTIINFAIMYMIVVVFEIFVVVKNKLINLINARKKSEYATNKNPYVCIIFFVIALVLLFLAYKVMYTGEFSSVSAFFMFILEGIVGTLLFFWSLSGIILFFSRRIKRFYFKGLHMFNSKEMSSRVNTNTIAATIICLMLFFTICSLSTTVALRKALKDMVNNRMVRDVEVTYNIQEELTKKYSKQDYEFSIETDSDGTKVKTRNTPKIVKEHYDEVKDNTIDKKLKEKHIEDIFCDTKSIWTYTMDNYTLQNYLKSVEGYEKYKDKLIFLVKTDVAEEIITISDYNKMAKDHNKKLLSLNDDEYILVCNNKSVCEAKELGLKENIPITIGDKTYKPKYKKCISEKDAMQLQFFDMNFISGVTIVPDSVDISKLYKCTNYMSASYNMDYKFEGNYDSIDDYVADKVVEENEEGSWFTIYPSKDIKNSITYATAFAIFIVIYIGIVFMITSAAILALKTLTDANDNIGKYAILRQIGVSEKMINKSLFYQNILFFGMPIALSIVHSIFGIKLVRDFFTMLGLDCPIKSIFISFGIILIIYGLYFILTNKTCKRIIRERR